MCFNACIKIKNKYGINIEKRLDDVFSKHGYHVVRNPAQYEKSISIYTDSTPWLTIASDDMDELDTAELQRLSDDFAAVFNTTAMIRPFELSGGEEYLEFHFSSNHNAFDEPPFIKEGPTALRRFMFEPSLSSGEPFSYTCINTGGISQGLELYIAGDFVEGDTAAFDPLYIQTYDYKRRDKKQFNFQAVRRKIRLDNGRPVYFYDFPNFMFPEGINPYSAALGFKVTCIVRRSISLCMLPVGQQDELDTLQLAIVPKANRECGVTWHRMNMEDLKLGLSPQ